MTAAQEIASETGCKLLDLRPLFGGSYAAACAAGLMYDANHPNAAGHQVIATALAAM